MGLFLGIDTSNYSTSVALYDSDSKECVSLRRLLPVKDGEIGLRQSDALFLHTKALPDIISQLPDIRNLSGVGVSFRPRSREGSYMPCFLAGVSAATSAAKSANVPLFKFSHQDGHIISALYSADKLELIKGEFIAFHISGGTTEILKVSPDADKIINCEIIAQTSDLNAGQAVDRVGMMLKIPFPAGVKLDKLAQNNHQPISIKSKRYDGNLSFSGLENQCKDLIKKGNTPAYVADYCIKYIENRLSSVVEFATQNHPNLPLLFSGGVMSNSYLQKQFKDKYGALFATPQFSSDNALGVAILASLKDEQCQMN